MPNPPSSRESRRILIVDDDPDLREILRTCVENETFAASVEVAEAADGLEALAAVRSPRRPHLIVLDLMLPNLNGLGFLGALKDLGLSDLPVVVMTAFSHEVNERMLRQDANVADYLQKPIDYAALMKILRRLLDAA